jgi:hypothetical protein
VPRKAASAVLVPIAAVALALALVAGYADRAVFDSNQFANRAAAALDRPAVKSKVADAITDDVVLKAQADLIGLRPVIHSVAETIVGSPPFHSLFHGAVEDVHAALFNQDQDTATLALADVGTLLTDALKRLNPQSIPKIGGHVPRIKIRIEVPQGFIKGVERLHKLEVVPPLLLVLGLVCAAAGIALAPDRRRAIVRGGIAAAAAGVVLLLVYQVGRAAVLHQIPTSTRAAAGGVWDAFLEDLRTALLIFTGAGACVAAAAASLIHPVEVSSPLRRAWALVATVPESTAARVVRALALVVAGIVVIANRGLVIDLVVLLVGIYLVYIGVAEILRVITPAAAAQQPLRRRRAVEVAIASAVAVVAIGIAGTAYVTSGALSASGDVPGTCNGFKALCNRPLDQVALPASHNSMSAATEPGWLFANQAEAIPAQLDDGIRALLWDTYYGRPTPDGHVKTVLSGGLSSEKRKQYVDELGRGFLDAALRIRDRLPDFKGKGGAKQLYLCHRFCETGALPLSQGLAKVRDYLVAHPTQVLVIVNEDYVKPADYVAAVRKAGLERYVYRGSTSNWPTLGEMVASNQRLVLFAEHHGGGAPWYHPAYQGIVQETPYTFTDPAQLADPRQVRASCVANRGGHRGSLFLLNHFITSGPSPKPSTAAEVNALRPLLFRARLCERVRHAFPNLLAVDFATVGNVVQAADALNQVAGGSR